jgi:hypothetical protein
MQGQRSNINRFFCTSSPYWGSFALQLLVTSRPENHLRAAFPLQDLEHKTKRFVLHQVQLELVEQDISHYLSM